MEMLRVGLLLFVLCAGPLLLIGCGSGESPLAPGPEPPGGSELVQVGPMAIRTAAATGFTAQPLPTQAGGCAFVALSGSQITWMASQALMDRIVYACDKYGDTEIHVCNLDGSGDVALTTNTAEDAEPRWSPDGSGIAFTRQWPGQDQEIVVMNADGSGPTALTANATNDSSPAWSPDGQMLAYINAVGNGDVFTMYADGSGQRNITNNSNPEGWPDWSPLTSGAAIAFIQMRDGKMALCRMAPDGTGVVRMTASTDWEYQPAWNSTGTEVAYKCNRGGSNYDILGVTTSGVVRTLMVGPDIEQSVAWSRDDSFVAVASGRGSTIGYYNLWLQQTAAPYQAFKVLPTVQYNRTDPDLGSPTMQTERVLIGPNGSDWGGTNPVYTNSDAGIVAFDGRGYRNFVRIGIHTEDLSTLRITPLADTGWELVGVVVKAAEIVNLREDAGRGVLPTKWQLDPLDAGAVVMYFSSFTGKLVSVLPVRDVVSPADAGADAIPVAQRLEGGRLMAEDDFAAVFDASGARIAEAALAVSIADGEVSVLR